MGRKKKNKFKINKKLKDVLITLITFLIIYFLSQTGILAAIDKAIEDTGLADVVDTRDSSVVSTTPEVKENVEIIEKVSQNIQINPDKLNILFFDVGQADCILILNNGKTALIDAGNNGDGELIVNGITALGIEKLDYVVGTHVHEDHIGGMSYIIDSFEIGDFYLPYNETTTTTYYKKLLASLTRKGEPIVEVNVGDKFELQNATLEVMAVDHSEPENVNNTSIVLEMCYGEKKYLFMGDAEVEVESARKWNDVDVLKVGHHGSNSSTSQEFLEQITPELSIIPVGEGNSYELPKDRIIKRLEKIGTKIYRTDKDGTIQLVSDGASNEIIKIDINFDSSQR